MVTSSFDTLLVSLSVCFTCMNTAEALGAQSIFNQQFDKFSHTCML